MKCPQCGNDLLPEESGGGFCPSCKKLFPKEQLTPVVEHSEMPGVTGQRRKDTPGVLTDNRDVYRGQTLLPLIPKLPSTLHHAG